MTFEPAEFLKLARQLVDASDATEAQLRTAVSRSYYSAFLLARERLVARGDLRPTATGADHRHVIRTLQRDPSRLGRRLDLLRDQRNRADYDLPLEVTPESAKQAVDLAEWIVARL
jgi:uncharacterized protein (UPF0332 family)